MKIHIVKVFNTWNEKRKRKKRAKAWLEDESLSDEGMVARIKSYPLREVKPEDEDFDMHIDY